MPALAASMVVICDRFIDSTTAYQGYGRELGLAFVQKINEFATQSLKPDATIWIDIPLDVAEARRKQFSLKKIVLKVKHGLFASALSPDIKCSLMRSLTAFTSSMGMDLSKTSKSAFGRLYRRC